MQTKWLQARFGLVAGMAVIFAPAGRSAQENPYAGIAVKNCFHLRPAVTSATQPEKPEPPPLPSIDVTVAGVTDVCGRPQVLLEITAAGKQTTRPILGEGDGLDGIDIVQINVQEDRVAARLQGKDAVLTLRTNARLSNMRGAGPSPGIVTK